MCTDKQFCCICMKLPDSSFSLWETDDNAIKLGAKLSSCVPEVEWLDEYIICLLCSQQLEQVYTFKKQCLQSDNLRKNVKKESELLTFSCFICTHCKESHETQTSLQEHVKITHRIHKLYKERGQNLTHHTHNKKTEIFKPFTCKTCNCRFANLRNLNQHTNRHSDERNHVCSFCGKRFKTTGELKVHELTHSKTRNSVCEICQKTFNTYKNLRTHKIFKHSDPNTWNYTCSVCERKFPIKSNFDIHIRRHLGVKSFACHLCDKQFVTKDELQKHVLSHTNVRPHKCELCEKEYKERRILSLHLKKAHNVGEVVLKVREKKQVCSVCDMKFFDKHKLKRHMRTHTGERPFECKLCDKKYGDKSYLTQHLKNFHNFIEDDKEIV